MSFENLTVFFTYMFVFFSETRAISSLTAKDEHGRISSLALGTHSFNFSKQPAHLSLFNKKINSKPSRVARATNQENAQVLFQAYYKCMETQKSAWNENSGVAHLALQGQTVRLSCNLWLVGERGASCHIKCFSSDFFVHNQLVERHAKIALHSWGLFFVLQVALYYSDVGLLRYHRSMVTDDDKIDKLTQ